jgi:hypothetical protein
MVPRAGFEPAALGLEVLCSIHLSYRGVISQEGPTPPLYFRSKFVNIIPPPKARYALVSLK